MKLVQGHGVNDMPYGWASENEWNKLVYRKWSKMLYRCYNEDYHQKNGKNYIGCTVCDRWLVLSNFVEDFPELDGYDREKFLNGELVLDKDIKSRKRNKKNKQYIMVECLLTTAEENTKEAMRTREYHELSEEHRRKISEANKGENHPQYGKFSLDNLSSKKVAQYDKEAHELIKVWDSMHDVERELGINHSHISACCKGKRKSAGGFVWKYVEEEF